MTILHAVIERGVHFVYNRKVITTISRSGRTFALGALCFLGFAGPARPIDAEKAAGWWSVKPIAIQQGVIADQTGSDRNWIRNEIDAFVLAKLKEKGLSPAPEAEPRVLCRRLYFDLTGLPPTPEQVEAFLKAHAAAPEKAFASLVDDLLASRAYGEKWTRHWLDIAHYADTHGFERDKLREHAWRYRDYVIRALNADKPYDQFLREQIAGDVLAPDDPDAVIATGFLAAGPWDFVGQVETRSEELRRSARSLDLDDMVTQVMTATMAMTVNCARCHDHKLDPIPQREYYQLLSIFAGLKRGDRPASDAEQKRHDSEKTRLEAEAKRLSLEIGKLRGEGLNLADIVGGGNGLGTGKARQGIDPRNGVVQDRDQRSLGGAKVNTFVPCKHSEFIDGVFIPDGASAIPVSSTGLTVTGVPKTSGNAWDAIRNGKLASQHSTQLGGVDYGKEGHSMLGLHANAGITFDLAAIRKASGQGAMTFSAVAGYGGQAGASRAEFRIYLDGKLLAERRIGNADGAVPLAIDLPETGRFLTLMSTDGGDGYGNDQIFFGDPRLNPKVPSQLSETEQNRLTQREAELKEIEAARRALVAPPLVYGVLSEPSPPEVRVLDRGDPESPLEPVSPAALSWVRAHLPTAIGDAAMPEGERRKKLADWITDPRNPLTRRVMANRLWHWHFGQGIVTTPSDFGLGGDQPSHPELLDFLAEKLLAEKWSLKALHRLILTSATWRQSSEWNDRAAAVDAQNRLLWRMSPRRLTGEEVRDAVLAVTGKLNPEPYGPGYRDFNYQEAYAPIYSYITPDSPELWRRSVYRFVVRTTPHEFLTTMDCPDPANLTPKRLTTTTALQSLALYNNDFMLRQSGYLAERLEREAGADPDRQAQLAFRLLFSREAGVDEAAEAAAFVKSAGLFAFGRALLNSNEFVYVD